MKWVDLSFCFVVVNLDVILCIYGLSERVVWENLFLGYDLFLFYDWDLIILFVWFDLGIVNKYIIV